MSDYLEQKQALQKPCQNEVYKEASLTEQDIIYICSNRHVIFNTNDYEQGD